MTITNSFKNIFVIAYDFDGVMTNNKVLVDEMGLNLLLLIVQMDSLFLK